MKKTLVALAVTATAGGALHAQSSVTVFGTLDAGVSYYSQSSKYQGASATPQPNITQSQWALSNSNNAASRIGFRGTEDLGGGLAASFWLESSLWNDTGIAGKANSQLFDRRSTVSLSGRLGEVRLGRDYNPTFWNDAIFDPFGVVGVGTSAIAQTLGSTLPTISLNRGNYARKSNSVGYFLPTGLAGVYGQAMYAFSENVNSPALDNPATANNARTGNYWGARVGYANTALDVAAAYGVSTIADNFHFGSTTNVNTFNLGASYDFGPVKLFGEYSRVDVKTDFADLASFPLTPALSPPNNVDSSNFLVGLTVPVGVGLIKASYSQVKAQFYNFTRNGAVEATTPDPKVEKFALGYVHNLSKRTALYATYAYTKNSNGAAISTVNVSSADNAPGYVNTVNSSAPGYRAAGASGYDFGIRHAF